MRHAAEWIDPSLKITSEGRLAAFAPAQGGSFLQMTHLFAPYDGSGSAGALERDMHREERLYHERRKMAKLMIALAVVGAVLLGGGIVALTVAHQHSSRSGAVAVMHPASARHRARAHTKA